MTLQPDLYEYINIIKMANVHDGYQHLSSYLDWGRICRKHRASTEVKLLQEINKRMLITKPEMQFRKVRYLILY